MCVNVSLFYSNVHLLNREYHQNVFILFYPDIKDLKRDNSVTWQNNTMLWKQQVTVEIRK